ncbi:hypothetical protein PLICRDRAFT_181124, partial [Plicaturopsis crispa FD-325 SS-3]
MPSPRTPSVRTPSPRTGASPTRDTDQRLRIHCLPACRFRARCLRARRLCARCLRARAVRRRRTATNVSRARRLHNGLQTSTTVASISVHGRSTVLEAITHKVLLPCAMATNVLRTKEPHPGKVSQSMARKKNSNKNDGDNDDGVHQPSSPPDAPSPPVQQTRSMSNNRRQPRDPLPPDPPPIRRKTAKPVRRVPVAPGREVTVGGPAETVEQWRHDVDPGNPASSESPSKPRTAIASVARFGAAHGFDNTQLDNPFQVSAPATGSRSYRFGPANLPSKGSAPAKRGRLLKAPGRSPSPPTPPNAHQPSPIRWLRPARPLRIIQGGDTDDEDDYTLKDLFGNGEKEHENEGLTVEPQALGESRNVHRPSSADNDKQADFEEDRRSDGASSGRHEQSSPSGPAEEPSSDDDDGRSSFSADQRAKDAKNAKARKNGEDSPLNTDKEDAQDEAEFEDEAMKELRKKRVKATGPRKSRKHSDLKRAPARPVTTQSPPRLSARVKGKGRAEDNGGDDRKGEDGEDDDEGEDDDDDDDDNDGEWQYTSGPLPK